MEVTDPRVRDTAYFRPGKSLLQTATDCHLAPGVWVGALPLARGRLCAPPWRLMCVTGWGQPGCRLSCQPVPSPQQKQARLQLCWAQPSPTLGGGGGRRPAPSTRPLPGAGQQPPIWTPGRAAAPGSVQRESGGLPRFGRKRGGCGGGAGCRAGGQGQVPRGGARMARRLWLARGPAGVPGCRGPAGGGIPVHGVTSRRAPWGKGTHSALGSPSHPAPLRAAPLLSLAAGVVQVRAGPPPHSPPAAP